MLAATVSAVAVTALGPSQRGGRARASSSRPWCAAPTLGKWSTSVTPTPVVCRSSRSFRPRVRSRMPVLCTSTASTDTLHDESGDARDGVSTKQSAGDGVPGVRDEDAVKNDKTILTPSQLKKAQKKAKYSKKHPGGHNPGVSLHLQAKAFARSGDFDKALKLLYKGSRKFPKNLHIGVSYAKALSENFCVGDGSEYRCIQSALIHLRKLVTENPESKSESPVVHQLIGVLEARVVDLVDAGEWNDDDDDGTEESKSETKSKRVAAARSAFELSTQIDPNHAPSFHAFAQLEMKLGRVNKAKRLFREARRCAPSRARTIQSLGVLESKDPTRVTEARQLFQDAIKLQKNHAPSYTSWAVMEEKAGNVSRAARVFREGEEATRDILRGCSDISREIDDSNLDLDSNPKLSRSSLLASYGSFESRRCINSRNGLIKNKSHARMLFREAVQVSPGNQHAWVAWAAAETQFARSAISSDANSYRTEIVDGVFTGCNSRPKHTEGLLTVISEGLRAHPNCVQLLHQRAVALRLSGDFDASVTQLETLAYDDEKNPKSKNPKIWHALGVSLSDAGRFDDAIDAFEVGAGGFKSLEGAINLPCLMSAAAEAARGGDEKRARGLFAKGSALASPGSGTDADTLTPYETSFSYQMSGDENGNSTTVSSLASVDGDGNAYELGNRKNLSFSGAGRSQNLPSKRERSTHLRLWAAFEKRCGKISTARSLFSRASVADPSDALVWLQWGQFERRTEGIDAARIRFAAGARRCDKTKARAFLYQAWADAELAVGGVDAVYEASQVYEKALLAHQNSPELWLSFGVFQSNVNRDSTIATHAFAKAAELAQGTVFSETVFDVWRAHGDVGEQLVTGKEDTEFQGDDRYKTSRRQPPSQIRTRGPSDGVMAEGSRDVGVLPVSAPVDESSDPSPGPPLDADTEDSEEASSSWDALRETLLTGGHGLPTTPTGALTPRFALLTNGDALNGWVKQGAPACAAAVVAGAWNALGCGGRREGLSIGTKDVLHALDEHLGKIVERKRARFTRLLGVSAASFGAFEDALHAAIAENPSGATLGGRSKAEPGISRRDLIKLVVEIANDVGGRELALEKESESVSEGFRVSGSTASYQTGASDGKSVSCAQMVSRRSAFAAIARLIAEDAARGDGDGAKKKDADSEEEPCDETGEIEPGDSVNIARVPNVKAVETESEAPCDVSDMTSTEGQPKVKKSVKKKTKKPPPRLLSRLGPPSAAFQSTEGESTTTCIAESIDQLGSQLIMPTDPPTNNSGITQQPVWRWRVDFWELIKKKAGLEKLRREKPSTAAVGNAGVMNAFCRVAEQKVREMEEQSKQSEDLSTESNHILRTTSTYAAHLAVGTKTAARKKLDVPLTKKDFNSLSSSEVGGILNQEWEGLRTLFARENVFLISHHRNHYAPIYALRESLTIDPVTKEKKNLREILTAQKGQRPVVWLSWEELRATYTKWVGYGIIACERNEIV